jgi:gliding motility-associated-like protein
MKFRLYLCSIVNFYWRMPSRYKIKKYGLREKFIYIVFSCICFIPAFLGAQGYEYNNWHDSKQYFSWNWQYDKNIDLWRFSLTLYITPRDTIRNIDTFKDPAGFRTLASISDTTGKLLFYTDGDSVFNENGYSVTSGWLSNVNYNSVNSAIFIRKPGQFRYYYLIQEHLPELMGGTSFSGLTYSIIDRFDISGKSALIVKNKPIVSSKCFAYKCTYGESADTVFLVVSMHGKDSVYKYAFTPKGISPAMSFACETDTCINKLKATLPIISSTRNGRVQAFINYGKGNIVMFPGNGQKYHFDALKASRGLFSSDGRFFYVIHEGNGIWKLIQYDFKNYNGAKKIDSIIVYQSSNSLGSASAMYLGPDQKIYFNVSDAIHVIQFPNQKGNKCNFKLDAYKYNFPTPGMKLGYRYGNVLPFYSSQKTSLDYNKPLCSFKTANIFIRTGFNDSSYLQIGLEKYFSDSNVFKIKPLIHGKVPVTIYYKANDTWLSFTDTIYVRETKKISISGNPLVCGKNSAILTLADTTHPYIWSTGQLTPSVAVKFRQKVYLTFNDTACLYSDTLQINTVNQKQYIQSDSQFICSGDTFKIDLNDVSTQAFFFNGFDSLKKVNIFKTGLTKLLINDSGCIFNDSIYIDLYPRHKATAIKKREICKDSMLSLVSLKQGAIWFWQTNKFVTDTLRFAPDKSGNVLLSTVDKCFQWDTVVLNIKICNENVYGYFLPNAFTPNNNGLNETYKPKIAGKILENMMVYNRWGQKVYEGNSGWDGNFGNVTCADGVYAIVLKYRDSQSTDHGILILKTTVHLIR